MQKGKKGNQSKCNDKDCYKIAKYGKAHGPNQAARCFQSKYSTIRQSTVRRFFKIHSEQVRIEENSNQPATERITNLTWGRPLMVGPVIPNGTLQKWRTY